MRVVLVVAGLVAVLIGGAALLAPEAFRSANGIDLAGNLSAFSETRAAGGGLVAVGAIIAAGAFVRSLAAPAALLGAAVYGAYGLSRLVSLAADGRPSGSLVLGGAVELLLGTACGVALVRLRRAA